MSNLFENSQLKYGVGYELKLGPSYQEASSKSSYHQFKYDFLPLSIDKNQDAEVTITENNSVTMKVPHQEGASEPYTMYQGSKQPSNKECILIIDTNTGEITLERVQSNFNLKRTRLESTNKTQALNLTAQRAITPTNESIAASAANTSTSSTSKKKTKGDPLSSASKKAANNKGKVATNKSPESSREVTPPPPTTTSKSIESKIFGDNLSDSDDD